jgi:hypothetical protein
MARLFLPFSSVRKILTALVLFAGCGYLQVPALAQHPGGHPGGGVRPGGGARIIPPRVYMPRRPFGPTTVQMRIWSGPYPAGVGSRGSYMRGAPLRPIPSTLPFFPVPFFFGYPFFRFGFGYGWFWGPCAPSWGWGFGCNTLPLYGYGFGSYATPFYVPPAYSYVSGERTLPRLYLKDGTVYEVTDYWVVNDELHFTLDGEDPQSPEHVIPFSQLDLQRTSNVNTRLGFRFVLRDEPLEQYLRDHPNGEPPPAQPPAESPPE